MNCVSSSTVDRSLAALLIVILSATELPPPALAAPPFVAAFDRFGRHREIDHVVAGRLLLTELSCTACHRTGDELLAPKGGPRLNGAADRLDGDWIRQFLTSPQAAKPGTTMPDVLAGIAPDERSQAVEALAAFLQTQHESFPEIKAGGSVPLPHEFWNKGDARRGRELYHRVGCVACHEPDATYETVETKPTPLDELLEQLDPDELAEMGLAAAVRAVKSVPHADLPKKYARRSLTHFLLNPERTRTNSRMPSLKLTPMEAAHLSAWLLRNRREPDPLDVEVDSKLVDAGRRLFSELRCAACHSAADVESKPAKPLAELSPEREDRCWGPPSNGLPNFALDEAQVEAIRAALAATDVNRKPTVQEQMLTMNCFACHERDRLGGVGRNRRPYFETVGNVDIGDEGRIPPPLTGVGKKLLPEWTKKVVAGSGDVRPHLQARMPSFSAALTAALPGRLEEEDRQNASTSSFGFTKTDGLEPAGRDLMDVGCVQCHPFRGDALPGVVGIDLIGVTDRVRPGWFLEFLLNPTALKPRTRMPSFFPGGKSQHPDLLEGDPKRQIAAMWSYLKAGETQPLPAKIEAARNQDFELTPTDRPLLLRTFMPEAGTHAVAVGFPEGVHFAFDAEHARLAQVWKGRFIDAQGTWFSRFAPPAEPLGDAVVTLPLGPFFAKLGDDDDPWPEPKILKDAMRFDGYRLDASGVPTFLYRIESLSIEDRIEATKDGMLLRRISLTPPAEGVDSAGHYVRPLVGESLKRIDGRTWTNENGLTAAIDTFNEGERRRVNEAFEWVVPLDLSADRKIEVRYSW